jgi:hypothetical protein
MTFKATLLTRLTAHAKRTVHIDVTLLTHRTLSIFEEHGVFHEVQYIFGVILLNGLNFNFSMCSLPFGSRQIR